MPPPDPVEKELAELWRLINALSPEARRRFDAEYYATRAG